MKKKILLLVVFIMIGVFYLTPAFSGAPIYHIGQSQDYLDQVKAGKASFPPDIAFLFKEGNPSREENIKAFRSGAQFLLANRFFL